MDIIANGVHEEKIRNFLIQELENVFVNLPYLKNAYTFTSLFRIIQADVPVVLTAERISIEEINLLHKYRNKVCIVAINETWKHLRVHGILPDIIMGNTMGGFDECLNNTLYIAGIEEKNELLQYHYGKQFFYSTKNGVARYLCEEAQKKSEFVYKYNILMPVAEYRNVYDRAVAIADYIGGEKIVCLGVDEKMIQIENPKIIFYDLEHCDDLADFLATCDVECHLKETVSELLPILDQKGLIEFNNIVEQIKGELQDQIVYIDRKIELCKQLYEMAKRENVYQDDLNDVVSGINQCTHNMKKNRVAFYFQILLERLEKVVPKIKAVDTQNEIEEVAINEVYTLQRIRQICAFLTIEFDNLVLYDRQEENRIEKNKKICRKKILFVVGKSQYHVMPYFIQGLKRGFQQGGYDVYLWNLLENDMNVNGYNIFQNTIGYTYIILMNGVFLDVSCINLATGCRQMWYDNKNSKVVAIFVDHPRIHADRLIYVRKGVKALFFDKYFCKYLTEYMPQVSKPYYLQMGGVSQHVSVPFEERQNKIVFFGSKSDLEAWTTNINQFETKNMIWKIIEELIAYPNRTIEEAAQIVGIRNNCMYSVEMLIVLREELLFIDRYIRAYFREKIVMEIAKSGVPFDIYGWSSTDLEQFQNVSLKEVVSFEEMLRICQRSRFVLNIQPWTKDGVQERVFNTMLGGSVLVTDTSEMLEREFQGGENVLLYHLDEIEKLPEMLKYYMNHPKLAEKIAAKGYEIAKQRHTWEIRAKEILDLLSE